MHSFERKAVALFLENHQMVLQVAFRNAPFPGMAEDIAQDVFVEFVSHADRWDYSHDVGPLLAKITRNVALRYWREHKKSLPQNLLKLFETLQEIGKNENELEHSSMQAHLHALSICLEKLPPRSREILDCVYRDKMGMQKIGDLYLMSVNAVRLNVFRIRKQLRSCIQTALCEPRSSNGF